MTNTTTATQQQQQQEQLHTQKHTCKQLHTKVLSPKPKKKQKYIYQKSI